MNGLCLDSMRHTEADRRAFYGSGDWRQARSVKIFMAGKRCEFCGSRRRLEVHHRVPLREAWAARLCLWNLQVLCKSCHRKAERKARARG